MWIAGDPEERIITTLLLRLTGGNDNPGPFRDIENDDTIVWLRTFPSLDDRKRRLDAFYDRDEWKSGLREITGEMIESQSHTVVLLPRWILSAVH